MGLALTDAGTRSICRSDDALWRRSLGTTFVLGRSGPPIELGGPAAVLWEVLGDAHTAAEATEIVATLHGRAPDDVAGDVADVLERLSALGVLASGGAHASHADPSPAVALDERPRHAGLEPAAAIAGWGLAGCSLELPDPSVAGWEALLETIKRERLSGLAVAAVTAGALHLAGDDVDGLRAAHREAMLVCLRLERLLLATLSLLEDAGIRALVIKGPSMAHARYDDPAQRQFGDIDLLVPAAQLDATFAVLTNAGHSRRYPEPRPGFDQRFGKGAAFEVEDGLEIDVHRTFASGAFGMNVDLADAFRAPESFVVGGQTVWTLERTSQLVSVAMHAVLGTPMPRLLNLRDVAQLLGRADPDAVIDVATRWHADGVVAEAVRHAAERFELDGGVPLIEWATQHETPAAQRRAMRAHRDDPSYAKQAIAALPAVHGVRARAAYLRAMLLPDRSYVAGRDGSQVQRWLRMARSVTRLGR